MNNNNDNIDIVDIDKIMNDKIDYSKFSNTKKLSPEELETETIASRLEKETADDVIASMSHEEIKDALEGITPEDDFESLDDETFDLIFTFLKAEMNYEEQLFRSDRITNFHEEINKIAKPSTLIELGKKKLEQIENGEISEKDLAFTEAEICILFTRLLVLRKILILTKTRDRVKEIPIEKTHVLKTYYEEEPIKEGIEEGPSIRL